jgi:hypothetical protein
MERTKRTPQGSVVSLALTLGQAEAESNQQMRPRHNPQEASVCRREMLAGGGSLSIVGPIGTRLAGSANLVSANGTRSEGAVAAQNAIRSATSRKETSF